MSRAVLERDRGAAGVVDEPANDAIAVVGDREEQHLPHDVHRATRKALRLKSPKARQHGESVMLYPRSPYSPSVSTTPNEPSRPGADRRPRLAREASGSVAQERRHTVDDLGPVDPGPVPGVGEVLDAGVAERGRVPVGEPRGDVRVAVALQRRAPGSRWRAARRRRRRGVLGARAVQAQDRPLRALVEARRQAASASCARHDPAQGERASSRP